jgi:methylmalonyl-CoA epimerase
MTTETITATASATSVLADHTVRLDHVAVAVADLETAVEFYGRVLGYEVKERRETKGQFTGMVSAVLDAGPWMLVLVQGTSPSSQVSRYVEAFGPGVQHIAIQVRDLPTVVERLSESGLEFDTTIIQGSGIRQAFTHRDPASGMMYELIERQEPDGHFTDESVADLFRQLEEKDAF